MRDGERQADRRSRSPERRGGDSGDDGDRGRGGDGSTNPGNNLHVSGLSHKVDNRELETIFSKCGKVQRASIMYDPHTRESRGFGFVTMDTPEGAEAALNDLNGQEVLGKSITVTKARRGRARTPTPGRYFGPPKRPGGPDTAERPYDPRPYDSRYRRDDRDRGYDRGYDRRGGGGGGGGGYRDDRRYDDRDRDRGGRYDDRDRRDRYDDRPAYNDRRYDDRRY